MILHMWEEKNFNQQEFEVEMVFIYSFSISSFMHFSSVLHIFFFSFQLCFPHSSEWSTEECAFNESITSVRTSSITHSEVCGLFRVTGTCSCWIFRLLWDFLHDYITSENCSYLYDGVGERKQQLQRKISSTDCWLNSGLWEGLSLSKLSLGQRRHTIIGHVLERACFFFF